MSIVNLGSIKNAPIFHGYYNVIHKWSTEEVNSNVKIDVPFTFSEKKTYFVFIKSKSATIKIEENNVNVGAINVITNIPSEYALSGGAIFTPFTNVGLSFGLTFPNKRDGVTGIYIRRPVEIGVASVFDLGIFEL